MIQNIRTTAGFLGVLNTKDVPFHIKRFYWLSETPLGIDRGLHAHKVLKQYLLCLSGSFKLNLETRDSKSSRWVKGGEEGVLIEESTWRVLSDFEIGTVVLVIASEEYDPDDYIYDYADFRSWVENK